MSNTLNHPQNNTLKTTVDIFNWAEQYFPRPLAIRPLPVNKPVRAVSGFILAALAGLIVWGLLDMFFSQLGKEESPRWHYLIIAVLILLGAFLLIRFARKSRKLAIVKMDKTGITTIGGEVFGWENLNKIVFDKAYKKNAVPQQDRCTGVRFYFDSDKLYVKYIVPDFPAILQVAHQVPVQQTSRFTGEFYY